MTGKARELLDRIRKVESEAADILEEIREEATDDLDTEKVEDAEASYFHRIKELVRTYVR